MPGRLGVRSGCANLGEAGAWCEKQIPFGNDTQKTQATARRVPGVACRLRLTETIFETPGSCMVTP